ncbi:16S rRNA (adenine(1518)-N(6)/adenine(1519)-N(6))-dimethyltransferase RsmA [Buchnera aphidicola]|uniref:Ribosomal RNA small subunit methyltransferase A n=1 Tax=Buchnera aphidicola (Cinara curvipes) TaxID=2518975 RepID=A0A451D6C1_9GAMM|nr:16S rRNA (adenine(1518)-N(6)/adenine(1519)-N(6))-dimethyltransferase RsmA [Buchnera aphidicola]VFP81390.1 Ribosomal RNA small subunit methyltransferase A [Buchnera aphidicola (Cinara curvipes)]
MNDLIYKKHISIKKFGQNFLINKKIINKIIEKINFIKNDNVIEIGPGFGALTFPICSFIKKMTVLEIDENIVFFLLQSIYFKKIKVILTDVMKFNFIYFFSDKKNILYRFIGNLPYNISSCFFLSTIRYIQNIYDMHFMFQKEVANRLLASPGNKEYGRLSVIAQHFYYIKSIINVNKCNFFPIPKVDSVFLQFIPREIYPQSKIEKYFFALELITRNAFQHRRKFLNKNLSKLFSKNQLFSLGINPYVRAENIRVSQYFLLAKEFLKIQN